MLQNNLNDDPICKMVEVWIEAKKTSIREDNWLIYEGVLQRSIKLLSVIYANGRKEKFLDRVGSLLKVATCELKENNIKYNKKKIYEAVS